MQIEVQDEKGKAVPGFSMADFPELFGDELEATATWESGSSLASLQGKTIRLRVALKDADLYALRFAE